MNIWLVGIAIWTVLMWAFLRSRLLPSREALSRSIAFDPTEKLSPEQLFGCLLSGNFALLMRDNFNQLASALPERRVKEVLAEHWGIASRADCHRTIDEGLHRLGRMSPEEKRAIAAWRLSRRYGQSEGHPREVRTAIERNPEPSHDLRSVLAWDVQQLAYLVRLALAAGHASREEAASLLETLAAQARSHFASWEDYSVSALTGLGLRGSLEILDSTAEWTEFSQTHSVLLGKHSPIRSASSWRSAMRDSSHGVSAGRVWTAAAAT
ncbi:DUF1266 domain-containing protein [Variovorax sp. J2P1-59]|uniref:DUF1266 domain-containing protein n=1 Tax=Variovorax flavidus TaxID=3053501 RepID=UPI002574A261|nr:DUF1266 domain-containing protein [Variovorax sp. J2P1-59]MDM0074981.1 DUF1266 domain-containing protein [Variovorax sp. J2P1-59]